MSNDIKPDDTVYVEYATPCCGSNEVFGHFFVVKAFGFNDGKRRVVCDCGAVSDDRTAFVLGHPNGRPTHLCRLKKIDPPAEGDSLPTRRDLEVTA